MTFKSLTAQAISPMAVLLAVIFGFLGAPSAFGQIYSPEGLHLPGTWNGYVNLPDPINNRAIRGTNSNNCGGGTNYCTTAGVNKWNSATGGTAVWKTTIRAAASGGDFAGGTYLFVISSGNASNGGVWDNKWVNVNVAMNTLQTYSYNSGPDNRITLINDNWYTFNWLDIGYGSTKAIFMATSAAPVAISSVSQSPAAGSITPSNSVNVTVNLSAAKSAEELVYVRYSTNNWSSSSYVLASGSGTTYTATIPAQGNGTTVQYYAFTSTVSTSTLSSAPNADVDAYAITYRTAGGTNGGPAYSYTSASVPPVDITFQVDMQNETVSGSGVYLAGTFNGYNMTAIALSRVGATSVYAVTVPLPQSASIQYKFINGSSWEDNISAPCSNGGTDRFYTVGTTDATIPVSCFSRCGVCPPRRPVTFRVDVQNEATVSGVYLAGEFNGWSPTSLPMILVSGTTYATTLNLEEGRQYSYKFVINSGNYENNLPNGPCSAGGGNRTYTVTSAPSQTLPVNCFNLCGPCAALSAVTVLVDMKNTTVTNGVALAGTFNGWSTSATQMGRVGNTSIYTATINVPEGSSIQYKFVNGIGSGGYEGNISAPCGNGNNRIYTVPTGNATLDTVCFNSCTKCPPTYPITFRVNMSGQTVTGTPTLVGSFNTYSITAKPFVRIGTTNVYEATVNLAAGMHQYKIYNPGGPNGGYETNFGVACGNGSNRVVTTISRATVLPIVCYNRCTDCGVPNVWTGLTGTNYIERDNWNAGVTPSGCLEDIVIARAANQPVIAVGSTINAGSITMQGNSTLTIGNSANLNLCGNLSGEGTVAGSVTLNGAGAQTMGGNVTVGNLTLNKTTGSVTVTSAANVSGTLTLANATSSLTIAPAGSLTLLSGPTGTARLAPVPPGATITGSMRMQRYKNVNGWHFVTAPFATTTLADYDEALVRVLPKNNANIFAYTESDTTVGRYNGALVEQHGWKVPASLSQQLNPGGNPTGYRLYLSPATSGFITSGTPFIGDKQAAYTFSPGMFGGGGYNLIGNPYMSEIDWTAVRQDAANTSLPISNTYYVYNPAIGNYATFTAGINTGTNGASQYIASSQGFFIKATAASATPITFKESHKSSANGSSFLRQSALANLLRISVEQGSYADEAVVLFYEAGLAGRDAYDADNLAGSGLDISTSAAGMVLATNVMPELSARYEVPVIVRVPNGNQVTMRFANLESFDPGTRIYVRDAFAGTFTEVTATNNTVIFSMGQNPAAQNGRFTLVFSPATITKTETFTAQPSLDIWPNPTVGGQSIQVSLSHFTGAAEIQLVDAKGRILVRRKVESSVNTCIETQSLSSGIYLIKAIGQGATLQQRVVIQ